MENQPEMVLYLKYFFKFENYDPKTKKPKFRKMLQMT